MKLLSAIAASAVLAFAAPAFAQTPSDPAALPVEPAPGPSAETIAQHQAVLTSTIKAIQAGKVDFNTMEPQLADAERQQQGAMQPALQQLGDIKETAFEGVVQGALKFRVTFAGGPTVWFISLTPEGKIGGLVVRGG